MPSSCSTIQSVGRNLGHILLPLRSPLQQRWRQLEGLRSVFGRQMLLDERAHIGEHLERQQVGVITGRGKGRD
jgi:hypothetical protein